MKKFALFGNPVAHSKSPRMHNLAFQNLFVDAFYGRILLETSDLLIEKFNFFNLSGANVTVPFKENIIQVCHEAHEDARSIGAANTIIKQGDNMIAYNTDAPGFMLAIKEFGKINNAIIIGAGGTARAISYILNKNNIKVDILNRSDKKRNNFVNFDFYTPQNFKIKTYDLVINTTPAGLINNELPINKEILIDIIKNAKFAFDAVYDIETPFLNLAKFYSLKYKDGKDMLLYQGVLAFNIFTSNKFDFSKVEQIMRFALDLK